MTRRPFATLCLTALAVVAAAVPTAPPARADETKTTFSIPAQDLSAALREFARQSNREILFSSDVAQGKKTKGVQGDLSADAALAKLLAGTGLVVAKSVDGTTLVTNPDAKEASGRSGPPSAPGGAENSERSTSAGIEAQKMAALEEIVVTGTNIRGAAPVGSPLIVIDRKTIDDSGYATVQQVIDTLPQNYGGGPNEVTGSSGSVGAQNASLNQTLGSGVNLRGLGSFSTLTLINGRRTARGGYFGDFFDISMIPLSAVERVEVLTDGASSIYGSDAIAGVVNFVLRKDFQGAETTARAGSVTNGRMPEYQFSHAQGWVWESGSLLASVDFYQRDNLPTSERPLYSDNLSRFGGPDLRVQTCNPGNIVSPDGTTVLGIPAGQSGTALTPAQLSGKPNLCDSRVETDALPDQKRFSAFLSGHEQISDAVRIFSDAMFTRRNFAQRTQYGNTGNLNLTVPASNPWYLNPFGGAPQPIQVEYSFLRDLGPETTSGNTHAVSVTLGGDAKIFGDWSTEFYATYSDSHDTYSTTNLVNSNYLASFLASSDPTIAFNPFGDGSNSSPATVAAIRGYQATDEENKLIDVSGKIDGPLFTMNGHTVLFAGGVEFRHESFTQNFVDFVSEATPTSSNVPRISRNVRAAFTELLVPLIADEDQIGGIDDLRVSISGRLEDYSDFGRTTNPKVGLSWTPVRGAIFRASYGTSFRAPGFADFRQDPQSGAYIPLTLPDVKGLTNIIALLGSNPDVGPEKAKTWTAGMDFAPPSFPGFTSNLTYFSIEYNDKIAEDLGTSLGGSLIDPALSSLVTRNPSQALVNQLASSSFFRGAPPGPGAIGAIVDLRARNLSEEIQRGLDLSVAYSRRSEIGQWSLGMSGAHVFKDVQRITSASVINDVRNTIAGPIDLRIRANAGLDRGPFGASLFVNYLNNYVNTASAPVESVSSWTTVDLNLRYTGSAAGILEGFTVSASVLNLFDRSPPFTVVSTGGFFPLGFDVQNSNDIGRVVSLQVRKRW